MLHLSQMLREGGVRVQVATQRATGCSVLICARCCDYIIVPAGAPRARRSCADSKLSRIVHSSILIYINAILVSSPQVLREHGVRVLTVREILAYNVDTNMSARVDLEVGPGACVLAWGVY